MDANQGIIVERLNESVQLIVEKIIGQLVAPLQDEQVDRFEFQKPAEDEVCVLVTPRSVHVVSDLFSERIMERLQYYALNSHKRVVSYSVDQEGRVSQWWELVDGSKRSQGYYSLSHGSFTFSGPKTFDFSTCFTGALDDVFFARVVMELMEDMNECHLEEISEMRVMRFIPIEKLALGKGDDVNKAKMDRVKATFISRFEKDKDAFMNPDLMEINSALSRKGIFIPRLDWDFKKHEEWDYARMMSEVDSLHDQLSNLDPLDVALKKAILLDRLGTHLYEERMLNVVDVPESTFDDGADFGTQQSDGPRDIPETEHQMENAYVLSADDDQLFDEPSPKESVAPSPVTRKPRQRSEYNSSSGNTSHTVFTVLKVILLFASLAGAMRTCSGSSANRQKTPKYERVRQGSRRSLSINDMKVLYNKSKEERLAAIDRADGRWSYDLGNDVFFKQGTSTRLQFVGDTIKYFADGKDLRVLRMSDPSLQEVNEKVMYAKHRGFHLYIYDANAHEEAGVVDLKILRGSHFDMLSSLSVSKAKKFMKQRKYTWEYDEDKKTFIHKKEGYTLRIGARKMIYHAGGESLTILLNDLGIVHQGEDTLTHQFNNSELVIVPIK